MEYNFSCNMFFANRQHLFFGSCVQIFLSLPDYLCHCRVFFCHCRAISFLSSLPGLTCTAGARRVVNIVPQRVWSGICVRLAQILQNMGIDVISALKCSLSKEKTKLGQSGKTRQKNRIKNCIVFFLRRKILQILVKRYKKVIYKLLICFNLLINY